MPPLAEIMRTHYIACIIERTAIPLRSASLLVESLMTNTDQERCSSKEISDLVKGRALVHFGTFLPLEELYPSSRCLALEELIPFLRHCITQNFTKLTRVPHFLSTVEFWLAPHLWARSKEAYRSKCTAISRQWYLFWLTQGFSQTILPLSFF